MDDYGAALAGFVLAMISQRRKREEEKEPRLDGAVTMEIPDMLPVLDGLIKKLGV